jgi:DDE superfamily endonuclease
VSSPVLSWGVMLMTNRRPCPPAPGPLEAYAAAFDPVLGRLPQRRGFRDYLVGLLAPRDRNKTLTGLAGTEPVVGAQHREAQRLQFFLSESSWDHEQVNRVRVRLLGEDPATRPHDQGVLVIDDTGDRKDGPAMAHVARQYLGSVGKVDQGIVAVTSLWADEGVYWPVEVVPYTPACRLAGGRSDPGFRTKPQLAVGLIARAQAARIPFRAVVADCAYGDSGELVEELARAQVAWVLALKPSKGTWAPEGEAHSPVEAAQQLAWGGPERPGAWTPVTRTFRDGRTETWWAADAPLPAAGWGPDRRHRLVVVTTDPATLPALTTWYLLTNLPRRRRAGGPAPANLAEVVRLYGLRMWVEQGYKQVKQQLGWADFQVRSDRAICRHFVLVCCAFSFCWHATHGVADPLPADQSPARGRVPKQRVPDLPPDPVAPQAAPAARAAARGAHRPPPSAVDPRRDVAGRPAPRPRLADPVAAAATLLACVVDQPAAPASAGHA